MAKRHQKSNFVQGGVYHVYNRGIRKQNLFHKTADYRRYIERMREYKERHKVSILAYCLMPNHIHLMIRQDSPDPISNFIQRLHTSYSMYYNKKYEQVGHVFQNRSYAKSVNKDEYLIHLSRYIHLNPAKLVAKLPSYEWSSYPAYLKDYGDDLLDTKFVLSMFKTKNGTLENARLSYKDFIKSNQKHFDNISHLLIPH